MVRHSGAAHAAIIQNLIPLIAILAAWLARGETATTTQLFGGGLIPGGLVIMRYGRQNYDVAPVAESESTYKVAVSAVSKGV
ncbi:MAG: EamA family transporter [Fuerstiella sp.]|nr:EamA family transporter [Fuerstiella sp.]MCP4854744.1 EamA family transporter [Fuerstiella sp.]